MADRIKVGVEGARDVARDLQAIGTGLDEPIREVLEKGGREITATARVFMRYRPTGAWKDSSGAKYGHIRDWYDSTLSSDGLSEAILNRHPAGPVWEWGGVIHPAAREGLHAAIRSSRVGSPKRKVLSEGIQTIDIPRLQPAHRAARAHEDDIHRQLDDAVDRLIEQYFPR